MRSPLAELEDLRFHMENLYRLKPAVNQAWYAIEKTETKDVLEQKKPKRRSRDLQKFAFEPASALRLRVKQGRPELTVSFALDPNLRLPVRVLVVFLDISGKRLHVMVSQGIGQSRCIAIDHDMFVDLHIRHRVILIPQTALEASLSSSKQGELVERCTAMTKLASQEKHSQRDVVTIPRGILYRLADFAGEFRRQGFIGINKKYPFVAEGQRVHRPLALLRPASLIVKLHHLRAVRCCDLHSRIAALGIDDVDLGRATQRLKTTRQITSLVSSSYDYGERERPRGLRSRQLF